MVLSMTGYGRAGVLLHGRDIKVELRSVNARFFEYSSRLPRSCAFLEDKLKKLVASRVSRGKVELSLSIQTVTAADTVVSVNWQLAEGYRAALNAMAERMDLKNDVSVGMLSRFPDVLTQTAAPTNEDELWEDVRTVAEQAVDAFVAMRAVEGEKMKADVAGRLTTIETLVAKIEENSAGRVQAYSDKLYARLQELLGGFAPVKAVQGMAEPLHYRNKAIASFATQRGKLVCGLYAEGTHRVLPGADCLLQEEILNKTLAAVLDAARACRWTAYDEDRGIGLLRHTVLRSSCSGKVLVTLVTPGPDLPGSKNFCTALRKKAPWVVSIVQNINPTRSSAVLGSREKTLYGPGFVLDTLCGTQFAISSRSFYQVNRTQTEVLYKKALELAKLTGRETVIDAYCGIGTIGLCAAPLAKQVIGVERNPAAVKDAAANARRNKIANARFVCADATEWMAAAAGEGLHPDVVFLDPPRAGSTPECITAVNKMKPRRVVYVSCDPETLARDVAAFTRLGWRAAKFCPVDLFPQTKHVETVVLLSHKKADSYIHIDVEFGEGEGKIPVDSIAKRAEAYKPKEKVTYKMIKEYIEAKYGFKVHTAYIAEVKRNLGLPMYDAPNAVEELKQPRKHPTAEKVEAIKDALKHFEVI